MTPRACLVALAGAALLLSGCGSDLPTKSEFVDQQRDVSSDLVSQLEDAGIDADRATEIIDEVNGCVYDAIASDEELLSQTYDDAKQDSDDEATAASVETKSQKCQKLLTESIVNAGTGG